MPTRLHHTSWLPLLALAAVLCVSLVTGRSILPQANAATTVQVSGVVAGNLFIDATACTPAAVSIGDIVPGTDPWKTAQDEGGQACSVDFGTTNHTAGTTLSVLEDPAAAASPTAAMKCVAGGCTGNAISDYEHAASEPAAGTSAFGMQVLSNGGIATRIWNAAPAVHDIQDSASPACATPGVGTGTCSFTWGATAATTTPAGSYQAQARMVVLGN